MKFLRWGPAGMERPGVLDDRGRARDLSGVIPDIGPRALSRRSIALLRRIDRNQLQRVPANERIGACVGGVGKIVCIGLNYSDHAAESGAPIPLEPIVFLKATSAIVGPNDDIMLPRGSKKTDWEVELGVVIGTLARNVSERSASAHIAGYCVVNDLSEREFQLERGGQWDKGKSCDTFAPIGPWLVTADDVSDPQSLGLFLNVDGRRCQTGNTRAMIFPVRKLVSYVSRFMSLHPGDIISTGTPPGVGMGRKPPRFLRPGSVMHLGIDGLGEQRQRVVPYKKARF